MNLADIKIGEKYKMIENSPEKKPYFSREGKVLIKKDAMVQVLEKDELDTEDVLVQDLSENKFLDGVWWISHKCLEIIERRSD